MLPFNYFVNYKTLSVVELLVNIYWNKKIEKRLSYLYNLRFYEFMLSNPSFNKKARFTPKKSAPSSKTSPKSPKTYFFNRKIRIYSLPLPSFNLGLVAIARFRNKPRDTQNPV